jgi:hypothetical protein
MRMYPASAMKRAPARTTSASMAASWSARAMPLCGRQNVATPSASASFSPDASGLFESTRTMRYGQFSARLA